MKTIKIAHLYYDLLNLYGESGNILALKTAIINQKQKVKVDYLTVGDDIDFTKYDIFYIGDGTDMNQSIVLEDILKYKSNIKKAIKTKTFIATGKGYELFGKTIDNNEALGIFDYNSKKIKNRIVGETIKHTSIIDMPVIGFENRNSNNDNKENLLFDNEGLLVNNFYGTYTLGPLLVRNPYLLDKILKNLFKYLKIEYKEIKDTPDYLAYNKYLENFNVNK